jgi:predicted regulator of Ras-like GTPase activity (Roadblock/LC7/MglB family)
MDTGSAIRELLELSTQIETVVVASPDGAVEGASVDERTAAELARLAGELLAGAEQVRSDMGREALAQLQAATPEGCVFLVLADGRLAVATTGADPTVGLVFYDLKTLLRQLERGAADELAGSEAADA